MGGIFHSCIHSSNTPPSNTTTTSSAPKAQLDSKPVQTLAPQRDPGESGRAPGPHGCPWADPFPAPVCLPACAGLYLRAHDLAPGPELGLLAEPPPAVPLSHPRPSHLQVCQGALVPEVPALETPIGHSQTPQR